MKIDKVEASVLGMGSIRFPFTSPGRGSGQRLLLGASINGSRAEIVACSLGGDIRERQIKPTGKSLDEVLDVLAEQTLNLHGRLVAAGHEVCAMGVGVPGPVDSEQGVLRYAEAIGWNESPVRDMLRQRLDALGVPPIELIVERASACTALYHFAAELLEGDAPLLYIHVGHSVAMAAAAGHGVLRGRRGLAGAIAHMPIDPDGPLCSCGRHGCANAVLTLRAMEQACAMSAAEMQARVHEERVQNVLRDTGRRLGRLLFELCLQYEPARMFVGGSAFQISTTLEDAARATLAALGSELLTPVPPLQVLRPDHNNVAVGAAIAAVRKLSPSR